MRNSSCTSIRHSRKGSLQLSINAIVVLIMAIVLLGLGMAFIRNQFSQFNEIGTVTEQARSQIMEQLQNSDKKMSIPTRTIELPKKDEKTIGIGIKNTGNAEMEYSLLVKTFDQQGSPSTVIKEDNLLYSRTVASLGVTDISIEPLKIKATTTVGDAIVKVKVFEWIQSADGSEAALDNNGILADLSDDNMCNGDEDEDCYKEYSSDTFFVTVQ